jgi:hypothetical protein
VSRSIALCLCRSDSGGLRAFDVRRPRVESILEHTHMCDALTHVTDSVTIPWNWNTWNKFRLHNTLNTSHSCLAPWRGFHPKTDNTETTESSVASDER